MRSSTSSSACSARARSITHALYRIHVLGLASEPTAWLAILMAEKMGGTSVKIEVGCRDDTIPKTVETRRHCEED